MDQLNSAKLLVITPDAETLIAWCARISSPPAQRDKPAAKLLRYCIDHKHWSIFEMANLVVEILTTRAISPQILRHRAFHFQEFSQRYSKVEALHIPNPRRQDNKNRQNSFDDLDDDTKSTAIRLMESAYCVAQDAYRALLDLGVAKEVARFVLPGGAETRLCMNGTIRDWIHYINLRTEEGVQKEHRDIALSIKQIFIEQLPIISEALGWVESTENGISHEASTARENCDQPSQQVEQAVRA